MNLKTLLCLVPVAFLASCSTKPDTQPTRVAATVDTAPRVAAPSLSNVSDSARAIRDTNHDLSVRLSEATRATRDAHLQVQELEAQKRITEEEAFRIRKSLQESASALANAESISEGLRAETVKLETAIAEQVAAIAAYKQRTESLEQNITVANKRIIALTQQTEALDRERDSAKAAVAVVQGELKSERKWKWRFFWWGAGMSLLVALYIGLKLNPKTSLFIP